MSRRANRSTSAIQTVAPIGSDLPAGSTLSTSSAGSSLPHHDAHAHPRIRAVQAAVRKSKKVTAEALKKVPHEHATIEELRPTVAPVPPIVVPPAHHISPRITRSSSRQPRSSTSSSSTASTSSRPLSHWRPILYEIQPFEDNYVDETFLSTLITNANVRPLVYGQLCLATCALTQRVCMVVLFFLVFFCMFHSLVSIESVLLLDAGTMLTGVLSVLAIQYGLSDHKQEWAKESLPVLPRILLLTSFLLLLSPLLNTLTVSYSSDTIWALTGVLCAVHVIGFDYRWINESAKGHHPQGSDATNTNTKKDSSSSIVDPPMKPREFEGIVSLNAGVFASVLLGSRLSAEPTDAPTLPSSFLSSAHVHCFAFVLWSFLLFGGATVWSYWIRRWSLKLHVLLTLLLLGVCSLSLTILPLPAILLPVFLLVCFGVNIIAPAALIWSQKYKNALQGPWDYDDANEMESDNL